MQDSRKNVLLKFIKLCVEVPCRCLFEGHKCSRRKPSETSVFEFSYKCVNLSLEELINIKVIFILRKGMFRKQNFNNVINLHKSFPGRQLNAGSRKGLEIQASSIAKRKTFSIRKFVEIKVSGCFNTL